MERLRAARLSEHVVVTGGLAGGRWDGGKHRDEVSVDLINYKSDISSCAGASI